MDMQHREPHDFIGHLDHWLEYLAELMLNADQKTLPKLKRQISCLLTFRAGANCNINHNRLLHYYYSHKDEKGADAALLPGERQADTRRPARESHPDGEANVRAFTEQLAARNGAGSMAIAAQRPIQPAYQAGDPTLALIFQALAAEDLFFMQGPPGTGKTTAIVEIILQTLQAKPGARILISSETHVAVDNALDRLAAQSPPALLQTMLRYPRFSVAEFENPYTPQLDALNRADALWHQAHKVAPALTLDLWQSLEQGKTEESGKLSLPRWQARNLAEMHQIIGVTCNQIDHLLDDDSEMFDLAIVDECSKATLPEWLMAMSVAKKAILVGDHKQLPPTFCSEESEVLTKMDEHKARLIRNGVLERLFDNLPSVMKGTLGKQFRMLPTIGRFISQHFYQGELEHHRRATDHPFQDFGWFTYRSQGYRVPAEQGNEKKTLVNQVEIRIILAQLATIAEKRQAAGGRKLSVALITPYRAQCRALREALAACDFTDALAIEVDTVDAYQGRQADIVFFSFVRNRGPATFYADDRRMNVAISRARDAVYLVGDRDYIRSKRLPVLEALAALPVLQLHDLATV